MFKKLFLTVLGILLAVNFAFASGVNKKILSETQLTNATNTTYTGPIYIQDYNKVGFLVTYKEFGTVATANVTVNLTGSYNGNESTDSFSAYFYDTAGGTTLQSTEVITANSTYNLYVDQNWGIPYINMTFWAQGVNTTTTANVTAYIIGQK
jgi:hypothetical protein